MNTSTLIYGLIILAVCVLLRDKVPYIGRLPGDFYFTIGQVRVFAPITSALALHLIISLFRNLLGN